MLDSVEQRRVKAGTFCEGLRIADTSILKKVCDDLAEGRAAITNDSLKIARFFKRATHRLGGCSVDSLIDVIVRCGLVSEIDVDDVLVDPLAMFEMEQRIEVFVQDNVVFVDDRSDAQERLLGTLLRRWLEPVRAAGIDAHVSGGISNKVGFNEDVVTRTHPSA